MREKEPHKSPFTGVSHFNLYIGRDKKTLDALTYWYEKNMSLAGRIRKAIKERYELDKANDRNENILVYNDPHQMRLATLPRIDSYEDYLGQGNKPIWKMFYEGLITQADVARIDHSCHRVTAEIFSHKLTLDAVNNFMMQS